MSMGRGGILFQAARWVGRVAVMWDEDENELTLLGCPAGTGCKWMSFYPYRSRLDTSPK